MDVEAPKTEVMGSNPEDGTEVLNRTIGMSSKRNAPGPDHGSKCRQTTQVRAMSQLAQPTISLRLLPYLCKNAQT